MREELATLAVRYHTHAQLLKASTTLRTLDDDMPETHTQLTLELASDEQFANMVFIFSHRVDLKTVRSRCCNDEQ